MNRRNFLRSLVGGVAVGAAVRTWPFRVYSFGSEPLYSPKFTYLNWDDQRKLWYVHPEQAKAMQQLGIKMYDVYAVPPYPFPTWDNLKRSPYPGRLFSAKAFEGLPIETRRA
jgi:hypothetical protein